MPTALVCGAGGFIGGHLVRRLKQERFWVRGIDLKLPAFAPTAADEFVQADLRNAETCERVIDRPFDHVYQLAADMGGAGYIFTGCNDAAIMHNSALINLHVVELCRQAGVHRVFYASSACIYPARNQRDPANPCCSEDSAYPADPDTEYGWEKLFSERLYLAYQRNHQLDVRIARFHNIFGPEGAWCGGREKAPAALCRKVAEAPNGGSIEIWGDGRQTRSFLYIDECIEGIIQLMYSHCRVPVNIGSEEMVTIDQLTRMIMHVANKKLCLRYVNGPTGVRGRNSDNRFIRRQLGWAPSQPLTVGLERTYRWVEQQVRTSTALHLATCASAATLDLSTPASYHAHLVEGQNALAAKRLVAEH